MLKFQLPIILLLFVAIASFGNSPRVPSIYEFAGIKLNIDDAARRQIQEDVDALTRNQTYFNRKVEKIDLYFPIVERVFQEENLPDDFKYLAIQESALIPDAVSSSNAVGFWQFKEASAIEVGLRVDRYIDERMHITESSRGAAKYLKKNNFFFDNWLYALLAYNTGPGGAEQHIDKKYLGKTKMEINKHTHWYIKKFLAHKIAFENEINKNYSPSLHLYEYDKVQNKSIAEVANYFELDQQLVSDYNKWLKKGKIPSDKTYLALIPVGTNDLVAQNLLDLNGNVKEVNSPKSKIVFQNTYKPISDFDFKENQTYPIISTGTSTSIKINGIPGFIASASDNLRSIKTDYGIDEKRFLKYNDMTSLDRVNDGQVYYLKSKKSKAKIHYHTVMPGENAWSISQKYGIKVKNLLTKNRMREEKDLSPGMVIWLRFIRPSNQAVEYRKTDAQNVIVKSIPNEISYPSVPSIQLNEETEKFKLTPTEDEIHQSELADEEFLFEELDDNTGYISENSYVKKDKDLAVVNEISRSPESNSAIYPSKKSVKNEEIYHIVKSSETLFSISRTYGVSIGELRQWNDIDNLDVLNVGQRILIIKPTEGPNQSKQTSKSTEFITHTVAPDETLYGIARQYSTTIKDLMDLNDKNDFNIKEGEILKISPAK